MSTTAQLKITVTHKAATHVLDDLDGDNTVLSSFQDKLEELTGVPPSLQKLLYKGKKLGSVDADSTTLREAGMKDGVKVTLIGSTTKEVESMEDAVKGQQKRERILRERALKPATKPRNTSSSSTSASSSRYIFHTITPLPETQISTPSASAAHAYLSRLASDPAILHVMSLHHLTVALLTELSPAEYTQISPNRLLGLNENKGEAIKLRIRTDKMDGFRNYADVRRTLCHELTHNVWGDHDDNFKEMNSTLNKQVAAFERARSEGTHQLVDGDRYEPVEEYVQHQNVLGGMGTIAEAPMTAEERRSRVLEATMRRLKIRDRKSVV